MGLFGYPEGPVYQKALQRYVQKYPEASSPDWQPSVSNHEQDWRSIYEDEETKAAAEDSDGQSCSEENPKASENPYGTGVCTAVAPCAAEKALDEAKAKKCHYTTVKLTKNPDRKYNVNISAKSPDVLNLQIVAGHDNNPAIINIQLEGVAGPCPEHKDKVFYVSNIQKEDLLEKTDSKVSFEAFSHIYDLHSHFLFLNNAQSRDIGVDINTCGLKKRINIKVYPDIQLAMSGKLSLSRVNTPAKTTTTTTTTTEVKTIKPSSEAEARKNLKKTGRKGRRKVVKKTVQEVKTIAEAEDYSQSGLVVALAVQEDGLEPSKYEWEFKKVNNLMEKATKVLDKMDDFFAKIVPGLGLKLTYPSLEASFSGQWKEVENSPQCDVIYSLSLKGKPLLGLEISKDILPVIIKAVSTASGAGPVGYMIVEMLERFKRNESIQAELSLTLKVELSFAPSLKLDLPGLNRPFEYSGAAEFTVGVSLELAGTIKMDIYLCQCTATLKGTSKAAIVVGGKVDSVASNITLGWKFTGAYLIITGSFSYGVSETTQNKMPKGEKFSGKEEKPLYRVRVFDPFPGFPDHLPESAQSMEIIKTFEPAFLKN